MHADVGADVVYRDDRTYGCVERTLNDGEDEGERGYSNDRR
jgi:hypothetical protein